MRCSHSRNKPAQILSAWLDHVPVVVNGLGQRKRREDRRDGDPHRGARHMTSGADPPAEAERRQLCVAHSGPEASVCVEEPLRNERLGVGERRLVMQDSPEEEDRPLNIAIDTCRIYTYHEFPTTIDPAGRW